MKKSAIVIAVIGLILYGLVILVSPGITTLLATITGVVIAIAFLVAVILRARFPTIIRRVPWLYMMPLYFIFLFMPLLFAIVLLLQGKFSVLIIIVMVSLAFSFFYGFLNIPLAVYHKYQEDKLTQKPLNRYPSLSIIVPAYNEEKCIAGTIETLLETYYPDKEIIVVDDGSTDNTYGIASSYASRGVKVIHRPNGGKAAALNHGLQFAKGEIFVCVDADSMVGRTALVELVRRFEDPTVVAVAGNVKVLNRNKLLALCQALEYVFDINISRRGLDIFGAVIVVPGCLGAFRTKAIRSSGGWDVETIVEDFDTTIKIFKGGAFDVSNPLAPIDLQEPDFQAAAKGMKVGKVVQASSAAVVYTEAPEKLGDLWKQRLRWYRGNLQTILKHRDAFRNPRFGALYTLGFPYVLISMIFIPISMVAVLITGILAILAGDIVPILLIFGVFTLLQFVVSLLAIQLDDEDLKLSLYSIFFVIGYKHFLDIIKIKAAFDVLTKRKMGWDKLQRIGLYQKEVARRRQVAAQR
ncbi:MAG: glycosyltransferase [Chloroflexi bacterium]|nr:glycosyltransferase [Chloroflexota bacterium]